FHLMQGYFDDPEATRATFDEEGWLHTGDIGSLDEQGNLRITGRLKDMFIVGGFNCYPAEIEAVLSEHPAIAQAAVLGVPDERMGEVGCACVVLRHGEQLDEPALIVLSRERMANYKVPLLVVFLDQLSINSSIKIDQLHHARQLTEYQPEISVCAMRCAVGISDTGHHPTDGVRMTTSGADSEKQ